MMRAFNETCWCVSCILEDLLTPNALHETVLFILDLKLSMMILVYEPRDACLYVHERVNPQKIKFYCRKPFCFRW